MTPMIQPSLSRKKKALPAEMAWSKAPVGLTRTSSLPAKMACQGSGFAVLDITGTVTIASMGGGNAYIHNAKTIDAEGTGWRYVHGGWTFLHQWDGSLQVEGLKFQVQLSGAAINFEATGTARIRVRGEGVCQINGHTFELTPFFQDLTLT